MATWTRALDEAAEEATAKGYWHVLLFYLLCGLAAIPTSFLVFSQVFTNATPQHWCAAPAELQELQLPAAALRDLTAPDRCSSYELDTHALFAQLQEDIQQRNVSFYEDGAWRELNTYQLKPVNDDERDEQITRIVDKIKSMTKMSNTSIDICTNGWKYSTEQYTNTLVTEFSLVCDRDWLTPISYTCFWFGSLIGNIIFGWMSDRYGRRFTILLMVYLVVPLAIAAAFPNSYTTYIILRLFAGLFFPALYQQPFILATELMPPAKRSNAGIVTGVFFSIGMCLLALIAYAIRDWYYLTLATSVPFVLLFGCHWLIPESPRWLAGMGRLGDAEKVLRALAKKNGIVLPPGFLLDVHKKEGHQKEVTLAAGDRNRSFTYTLVKDEANERKSNIFKFEPDHNMFLKNSNKDFIVPNFRIGDGKISKSNAKEVPLLSDNTKDLDVEVSKDFAEDCPKTNLKRESSQILTGIFLKSDASIAEDDTDDHITEAQASMLDLFRYPNIRKKFLIVTFDCLIIAVVYNGLCYNTSNLGINEYVAFFLGGAVEIPAYLLVWRCMERYGRRSVLCVFMIIGGISCLMCGLIPEGLPWVILSLAMIGKLCAAACLAVSYLLIGELLPTVVRAQGIGLSSFITGFGVLTCPYIVYTAVYMKTLPLIITGVISLIAGMLPLFLPETLNQPLPQTLNDGEMFGRNIKVFSRMNIR